MSESRKAVIHKTTRLFDDFFKIDEVLVSHEQRDGTMSPDERRLIFERGDAVAVMLYNPDSKSVIIVNQFKVPSLIARRRDDPNTVDGWVTEATAGMIDEGETPEKAIIRETLEETGYRIANPKLISKFFSSAGGTSERIFLYFAQVRASDKVSAGGGLPNEDVSVVAVPVDQLFTQLAKGSIDDPKLAIGAYWLKDYLNARDNPANQESVENLVGNVLDRMAKGAERWLDDYLERRGQSKATPRIAGSPGPAPTPPAPSGPLPYSTVSYGLKDRPGLVVGYKTGRLDNIQGATAWVNSENTDMLMDRFIGNSISARIRYLGANRDVEGNVIEDRIAEALRRAVGPRGHVRIGTVLMTESGTLKTTHQVQRIFHVATVEASPDAVLMGRADKLAQCVEAVLTRAELENKRTWRIMLKAALGSRMTDCDSILLPMMGAGQGNLKVEDVAKIIITAAVDRLRNTALPTVKKVYFIAFQARDRDACEKVFQQYCADGRLIRLADET